MTVEYLHSGSTMCPLIRLYAFVPQEIETLRKCFESLAAGEQTEIALHELPMYKPIDNIQLVLRATRKDSGVHRDPNQLRGFELRLTPDTFGDLAELARPFEKLETQGAFQWLVEHGPVNVLLSPSGFW